MDAIWKLCRGYNQLVLNWVVEGEEMEGGGGVGEWARADDIVPELPELSLGRGPVPWCVCVCVERE